MDFVNKTLYFIYSDLPKEGFLVFTFDQQSINGHTMYQDMWPVAWKVVHLYTGGDYQFYEIYNHRFAVAAAKLENGQIKSTSAIRDLEFKQQSTLTGDIDVGFKWSEPQTVSSLTADQFAAQNGTGNLQKIVVCSHLKGNFAQFLLYLSASDQETVIIPFKPRLRIYATSEMKEWAVIKDPFTSKPLWDYSLDDPNLEDHWVITYDVPTGNFKIIPHTSEEEPEVPDPIRV